MTHVHKPPRQWKLKKNHMQVLQNFADIILFISKTKKLPKFVISA